MGSSHEPRFGSKCVCFVAYALRRWPQNLYSGHLRYVKDDPLFITTLQSDLHALKGKLKQGDLDMMVKRLKLFEFKQKVTIPSHVAKGCGSCFAHFILGPGLQTRVLRSEAAKRGAMPSGETPEPKRMMCLSWTVDDVVPTLRIWSWGMLWRPFETTQWMAACWHLYLKPT